MKQFRFFTLISLLALLLISCSTQKEPVGGWHKRDHWYAPTNWHLRSKSTGF